MEHTGTPWKIAYIGETETFISITDGQAKEVYRICKCGGSNQAANARRIVAAVNAVEGIETEQLEKMHTNEVMRNMLLDRCNLKIENARLLEALKGVCQNMGWDDDGLDHIDYVRTARAAIAEAETSSAHPSQPAQVIANLTRKLGDAIKALRDIAETLMETNGGFAVGEGNVKDAWETAKEALKPYEPDSPDPCDLARDYNDALRDAEAPTPYDP